MVSLFYFHSIFPFSLKSSILCGPPSRSVQSSTCYLTVAPSPDTSKGRFKDPIHLSSNQSYVLHLKYELVPPHPPFFPSVNLKFDDLILVNSGDFLCAVCAYVNFDHSINNEAFCSFSGILSSLNCTSNCFCGFLSFSKDLEFHCNSTVPHAFSYPDDDDSMDVLDQKPTSEISDSLHSCRQHVEVADNMKRRTDNGHEVPSKHTSCYVHFYGSGPSDGNSNLDSPFHCNSKAFPITVTDEEGTVVPQTFTHRCCSVPCGIDESSEARESADIIVKQIVFDAEQFLDDTLRTVDSLRGKFVSLKDYDMQIVQVVFSILSYVYVVIGASIFAAVILWKTSFIIHKRSSHTCWQLIAMCDFLCSL